MGYRGGEGLLVSVVERVRQSALDHSASDWVAFLGPDEIPDLRMGYQCRRAIEQWPEAAAFRDLFLGAPLERTRPHTGKLLMMHRERARFHLQQRAHE